MRARDVSASRRCSKGGGARTGMAMERGNHWGTRGSRRVAEAVARWRLEVEKKGRRRRLAVVVERLNRGGGKIEGGGEHDVTFLG